MTGTIQYITMKGNIKKQKIERVLFVRFVFISAGDILSPNLSNLLSLEGGCMDRTHKNINAQI